MIISLNGQKETCDDGATIAALLEDRKIRPEMVSVEVNDAIIERGRYDQVRLKGRLGRVPLLHGRRIVTPARSDAASSS